MKISLRSLFLEQITYYVHIQLHICAKCSSVVSYVDFIDCAGQSFDSRLQSCQAVVSRLPDTNYQVLKYLAAFLDQVYT